MVVVGFQPSTGSWFSWNGIVGIYILKISISWQHISVIYLNIAVMFKYGIQQYFFKYPTPIHLTPPPPHCPTQYPSPPPPSQWKSTYFFTLHQDKLFLVIFLNDIFQYKMIFCIHEWMSSVFEILFLFWFLLISLLSSWDDMDVPVELLSDDSWAAEYDKTGLLNVGVDCFGRLY